MSAHANKKWRLPMTALSVVMLLLCCFTVNAQRPVVASYYMASGDPASVNSIPANKLTHILYAFVALCGDNSGANEETRKAIDIACRGKAPYSAVFFNEKDVKTEMAAFRNLKKRNPDLHIIPSFGGWTLSQPFHGMAQSDSARMHFVESALALIAKYDVFDGIDIDWEYPGGGGNSQTILKGEQAANEKRVYTHLMKELRAGLNKLEHATGRQYQLTAAVSGSKAKTMAIDWENTAPVMDYIFAMTYDFAVGDGQAAHHTNLFTADPRKLSTERMIDNLLDAGVPAEKLVVGVAFYGRGWNNSDWQGGGFGDVARAVSSGSYSYKDLTAAPPDGFQYGYDAHSEAAYLFNPSTQGFISFDDVRSVTAKANWAKKRGLAGLFSWQILQDNGELIDVMHEAMQQEENKSVTIPE